MARLLQETLISPVFKNEGFRLSLKETLMQQCISYLDFAAKTAVCECGVKSIRQIWTLNLKYTESAEMP